MPRLLSWGLLAVLLGVGVAAPPLPAQTADPKSANQALPFYTKPDARARDDLGTVTRSLSRAVLLVGHPKAGIGTAWVLSCKHRLLVTNAHVADMIGDKGEMLAVVNGTEQVHKVKRAWYHVGVRRHVAAGKISIRAECPADGDVDVRSPDLAVLELNADGPALTTEMPMASRAELNNLFAQTVGMLGFPSHSTGKLDAVTGRFQLAWPALGEKAQATFHDGVISRLTNFRYNVNVPEEEHQFVQSTLANWPGFSGSPIYLANGHVVAINNSWRPAEARGVKTMISQAIRVDCLWELLVHRGLDSKVPVPVDTSQLRIKRWLEVDEAEKQFRQAVKLVDEAAFLIDYRQEFLAGVRKCNEAIKLAPDYPDAYRVRCAGWNNYYSYDRPPKAEARKVLEAAIEDAKKYSKLMSSDPRSLTAGVNTAINMTAFSRNGSLLQAFLPTLEKAVSSENLTKSQRAEFYSLRGMCHFNLQSKASAKDDFNDSIRLDPENDMLFDNRARFWEAMRRDDLAEADRARARALRKKALAKVKEID